MGEPVRTVPPLASSATAVNTSGATDLSVEGAFGFWQIATAFPDRPALITEAGLTTYGSLSASANRLARGLRASGCQPGSAVTVAVGNRAEFFAIWLAAMQIGLYVVTASPNAVERELAYLLADSQSQFVFVGADTLETGIAAAARAGLKRGACLCLEPDPRLPSLRDFVSAAPSDPPSDRRMGRPLYYTSGTTGRAKGVLRPLLQRSPEADLAAWLPPRCELFGFTAGEGTHLLAGPLYHAAPQFYANLSLHLGHRVVVMPRFDAGNALALMARHQVTTTFMVPTMFARLLALPSDARSAYDPRPLRQVLHAGAPCPDHVKRAMLEWWGPVIYEFYSSSEGGGTSVSPTDWLARPGTVGRPWPGASIKILAPDGSECASGEVGEICLRNSDSFEYLGDPEKTAGSRRGEYFTVGDVGWMDEEGWLFIADRRADLILSGGVNVYPAEVESVLLEHPLVDDAAVVGVPDADLGQRVAALVQPTVDLSAADLPADVLTFCRDRLSRVKVPRLVVVGTVPRNAAGKVDRKAVRVALHRVPPP
jgi:long-chain acyl-CoA synthetase